MSKLYKLCTLICQKGIFHHFVSQYYNMLVLAFDCPTSLRFIYLFNSGLGHCTALLSTTAILKKQQYRPEWFLHSHIFLFYSKCLLQFLQHASLFFFVELQNKSYSQKIWKKCTQEHLSNALKSLSLQKKKMLSNSCHSKHPHSEKKQTKTKQRKH